MKSVGAQLKEARLARGWTPKAAAKATKIKEQQILQLEGEAFDKFAAPAYVRGFVRIYARTLGLDEAAVTAELERLLAAQGDDVYLTTSPVQYSAEGNSRFLSARGITYTFALVLTAALLVVAGIHIVMLARDGKTAKAQKAAAHPAAVAAAPAPDKAAPHPADEKVEKAEAVAPPAEEVKKAEAIAPPAEPVEKAVPAKPETVARAVPVSVAAVAHDLVLQADEDCWIHVQAVEADGVKDLFQGVLAEDAEKHFTAAHFRIKIAIPAALTVTYDGNTIRHNESRVPAELTLPTE
jgi:cytoskeleton protein RodZ